MYERKPEAEIIKTSTIKPDPNKSGPLGKFIGQ